MGKYTAVEAHVFSVFGRPDWVAENIKTYPNNFLIVDTPSEFIRVTVIPSGKSVNLNSVSGIVIVDIFISAGNGPSRATLIADKLDQYLNGKVLGNTQFFSSTLQPIGKDPENTNLYRSSYTIPFNHFGVF